MNKAINGYFIDYFSVKPTYSGMMEGDPTSEFAKNFFLKGVELNLKEKFGIEEVNVFSKEIDNRLRRYKVEFVVTSDDYTAGIVCFVEEVDNITETVQKILDEYPEFKKQKWEW